MREHPAEIAFGGCVYVEAAQHLVQVGSWLVHIAGCSPCERPVLAPHRAPARQHAELCDPERFDEWPEE